MIILKVEEINNHTTVSGTVLFSFNPFKVPWFSNITYESQKGFEQQTTIDSIIIIINPIIENM